ncbi:MAG: hypothetical protein IR153_10790 [Flavobacterium sp.]|nr:hypothetical protein [Flavobacterium sp.]
MNKLLLVVAIFFSLTTFAQTDSTIYRSTEVDEKPQLESGMYTMSKFIRDNFQFPDLRNKNVTVFTSFIIEVDGSMREVKAFSAVAKDYLTEGKTAEVSDSDKQKDAAALEQMKVEAARVLLLFNGKWEPAKLAGKPVRCLYNYPITFRLE